MTLHNPSVSASGEVFMIPAGWSTAAKTNRTDRGLALIQVAATMAGDAIPSPSVLDPAMKSAAAYYVHDAIADLLALMRDLGWDPKDVAAEAVSLEDSDR